jgi:2-oxoglutarate-Fe(II)-dependent oxygenase superfamily protein
MILKPAVGENLFVIPGFLPAEDCERLIARSEALGYEAATLGEELVPQLRNNARLILDDPDLGMALWERARALLPARLGAWQAVGLNPRFRFYRYTTAELFGPHGDGCISLDNGQQSQLTFMVYLSDVAAGGATRFYSPGGVVSLEVRPERGKAIAFAHRLIHEGAAVIDGCKYVLRSDVMFCPDAGVGGQMGGA